MKSVVSQIDVVAPTEASVLILGETGTGKELVAHEIHRCSARKDGPLVRDKLVAALEAANWKISGPDSAAELMGLKPTTLLSRMAKWGVKRPEPGPS